MLSRKKGDFKLHSPRKCEGLCIHGNESDADRQRYGESDGRQTAGVNKAWYCCLFVGHACC